MTIEEAITVLNCVDAYGIANEAKKMAINILKKQIPKKTKETSLGTECSVCGSIVKIRSCARFAYCPYCGNKIDWTKEGAEE